MCVAYIPDFGISATLIITELRQYKTSLTIDLNTEEGESFAMMVAMGFFTFSAPRYQMTIPSPLTEMQVKQAILNFSQTLQSHSQRPELGKTATDKRSQKKIHYR